MRLDVGWCPWCGEISAVSTPDRGYDTVSSWPPCHNRERLTPARHMTSVIGRGFRHNRTVPPPRQSRGVYPPCDWCQNYVEYVLLLSNVLSNKNLGRPGDMARFRHKLRTNGANTQIFDRARVARHFCSRLVLNRLPSPACRASRSRSGCPTPRARTPCFGRFPVEGSCFRNVAGCTENTPSVLPWEPALKPIRERRFLTTHGDWRSGSTLSRQTGALVET